MATSRWMKWLMACVAVVAAVGGHAAAGFAGNPLSGAALDAGCRAFADKAAKYGAEWEQRQCVQKLKVGPQEFDSDYNTHLKRCLGSVGTAIDRDLQTMESYLQKCRGAAGTSNQPGGPPPAPPQPTTAQTSGGDVWDLVVLNSFDQARSQHSYRIPTVNGNFVGACLVPGGMEFSGNFSGSVFRAFGADKTGYQANFFGRMVSPERVEGTGCDNRNNGYTFTLIKRK